MEFQLLDEKEFRKFHDQHPLKNFLQTPEIGKLREKSGWTVYYVGVKKGKKIIAGSMLVSHPRHFGCLEFYAPRGLLVDYEDEEVLDFFVQHLKSFIKEKKGYILRIDPYYILKERDINGDVVEGGVNHEQGLANLRKLGFQKSKTNEQISWSFCLDLDRELDEIMADMRTFTKRNIKKAIKNEVVVREASFSELSLVKEILDATCERKNFANRNLAYFEDMYHLFMPKNQVKFELAFVPLKQLEESVFEEIKKEEEKIHDMEERGAKETKIDSQRKTIEQLRNRQKELQNLREKYGDLAPASAGVFMTYGDEVLYLFGGNKEEFMHFGCPHYVQWEMIRYAKENGFKRYNFYGISGNFDENDKSYGIYDFKKGFTGYVEELIGEQELVILPLKNFLFKIVHCIKK